MRASIIAVFFNNEETAVPCLDSLLALRWPEKELIIVFDTAARDNTRKVLEGYRGRVDRYVEVHGVTLAQMYNAGIEVSTGDPVFVVDGDTLYPPDYLERIAACMGDDPRIAGALGRKRVWKPHSFYTRLIDMDYAVRMRKGRYSPWTCWVYRRKPLMEMGGYHPRCGPGDFSDYEIGLRLKARGYQLLFCEDALWFEIERKNLRQEFWRHFRRGASVARTEPTEPAKWPMRYAVGRSAYPFGILIGLLLALWIPMPWALGWLALLLGPLALYLGKYAAWGLKDGMPGVVLYAFLGTFYRDSAFTLGYVRGRLGPLPVPKPGKL